MNLPRPGSVSWSWLAASVIPKQHLPRVSLELGRRVPAWVLRLACAVVATGCTTLLASDPLHWMVAGPAITAMVLRPAGVAPAVFVVGMGLGVLALQPATFDLRVFALVFGLHLTVQLATVVGDLPWTGAVEARVVAAFAAPFLAIQVFVQAMALVGAWASSRELPVPWLPVVAGIALAVLAWTLVVRLGTVDDDADHAPAG